MALSSSFVTSKPGWGLRAEALAAFAFAKGVWGGFLDLFHGGITVHEVGKTAKESVLRVYIGQGTGPLTQNNLNLKSDNHNRVSEFAPPTIQ